MTHTISKPELLNIEEGGRVWFGGRQDWFSSRWRRMCGCGPTCCANIFAYLAESRGRLRPLFPENAMSVERFAVELDAVFECVTPRMRGLNRPEDFVSGALKLAGRRGVELTPRLFVTADSGTAKRPDFAELADFVARGLDSDCPVAFLCLSVGGEKRLQDWHWITLTSFDDAPDANIAVASDGGQRISFDQRLWYETTAKRGGLVYFEG